MNTIVKKTLLMAFVSSSTFVQSSDQATYDGDDGIHHPNSTAISYSAHKKAVRDTGEQCPNAYQYKQAYDALAQKPGTLVYKYEQEKKQDK